MWRSTARGRIAARSSCSSSADGVNGPAFRAASRQSECAPLLGEQIERGDEDDESALDGEKDAERQPEHRDVDLVQGAHEHVDRREVDDPEREHDEDEVLQPEPRQMLARLVEPFEPVCEPIIGPRVINLHGPCPFWTDPESQMAPVARHRTCNARANSLNGAMPVLVLSMIFAENR